MSVATTRPLGPIRLAANRATVPGPVATSRTTAFGWRLHSSSNTSAHGSNSRGTSTSSYALGTASSVNWKPVSSLMGVPLAHKAACCARSGRPREPATTQKRDELALPHGLPSHAEEHSLPHCGRMPRCASQQNGSSNGRDGSWLCENSSARATRLIARAATASCGGAAHILGDEPVEVAHGL